MAAACVTLMLGFAVGACGDDDPAKPKEAGAETAPKEAGAETSKEAGPATGQCLNAADGALLDSEAKRDAIASKAGTCGLGCLGNPDKNCAIDCVKKDTGLSDGCSGCYAATIACATNKCLAQCAADPSSQGCTDCRSTNCDPAFFTCSGLTAGGDGTTPSEAGAETSPDTGAGDATAG